MQDLSAFQQLCNTPQHVTVIVHHRPDADALGAGLALAAFLEKKQQRVTVIAPSPYPSFLAWMPGDRELIIANQGQHEQAVACIQKTDLICCVDFSSLSRINALGEAVAASKAKKVVIDHHANPESFADLYFWDTKAAAAAEIVYRIIEAMGEESLIDKTIAEHIYAGIMTDTGSFRNPNTTVDSHLITAKLIQRGADTTQVYRLIYENNSINRLEFLGFAISQRLVVLEEYNAAYFVITQEDFKQFDLKVGDTEGLINYALTTKDIVVAALIKDKKDIVRISLRSSGNVPVNEWAQKHFDGGGHKNASGGSSTLSLEDTVAKFKDILKNNKQLLNSQL